MCKPHLNDIHGLNQFVGLDTECKLLVTIPLLVESDWKALAGVLNGHCLLTDECLSEVTFL